MEIYDAANAAFGPSAYGWDGTGDECGWEYVSCDEGGKIVNLNLADRDLTGTISTWIGVLTHLETLSMDRNGNLNGELPVEIGYLSQLRQLNLFNNALRGQIPNEIGEGCQTASDSGLRFLCVSNRSHHFSRIADGADRVQH